MTNEIRKLLNIKDPNIHFSPDSVQEQDDIVQDLNRELNRYRIQWMNQGKHHDRRLYNKRKRYQKLFLKKEADLHHTLQGFTLFDSLTNTGHIINYLLDQNHVFKETYRMGQNLRYALEKSDYDQFMVNLYQAPNQPLAPGLRRLLEPLRNSSLIFPKPLTIRPLPMAQSKGSIINLKSLNAMLWLS